MYPSSHFARYEIYQRRRLREIKRIVEKNRELQVNGPELIPNLGSTFKNGLRSVNSVIWAIIAVTSVTLCVYQTIDRIQYFADSPVKVDARINEEIEGDFPGLLTFAFQTDQGTEFNDKLTKEKHLTDNDECREFPSYMMDNESNINDVWRTRSIKHTFKVHFEIGKQKFVNKTSVEEKASIISVQTFIKNNETIPLNPQTKLVVQNSVTKNMTGLEADAYILMLLPKDTESVFLDMPLMIFINKFLHNDLSYSYKRYLFLNRKQSPCADHKALEKCRHECFVDLIATKIRPKCQLPFLPKTNVPDCLLTTTTCEYMQKISQIVKGMNPQYVCQCTRECKKSVFTANFGFTKPGDKTLVISAFSNRILTFSEYFCYDIIALLCDVGGYLGLYTGISCLSLIEAVICIVRKRFSKFAFTLTRKTKFERKVLYRIRKLAERESKIDESNVNIMNCGHLRLSTAIKIIVWSTCTCFCIYQLINRITFFLGCPVYVTIQVKEDHWVQVPTMVLCNEHEDVIREKERLDFSCPDNKTIADLLDPPSIYAHNATGLWRRMNNEKNFVRTEDQLKYRSSYLAYYYGIRTPIQTVFGECTKVESEKMEYRPTAAYLTILLKKEVDVTTRKPPGCDPHSKFFLSRTPNRIDFTTYSIYPLSLWVVNIVVRQSISKINTPVNPCVPWEEFIECEEKCLEKLVFKRNVTCRLPFFNASLPLCDDSRSAKHLMDSYTLVHANTDARRDCGCRPACDYTFYTFNTIYGQIFETLIRYGFFVVKSELESNHREVFQEELAIPLSKLVCDVGSILGFFLGVSFFTLLHQLPKISLLINNYKLKR